MTSRREPKWIQVMAFIFEAICWGAIIGAIITFFFVAGCGISNTPAARTQRELVTRFVSCFATPPPVEDIDWPTAPVFIQQTQIQRFKWAYGELVRWSREQFYRCLKAAEESGLDSTTVIVNGPPDGGIERTE